MPLSASLRPIAAIAPLRQREGMSTANYAALIPELPTWNNGAGIDPESWIGCVGNFELAAGYSFIFWPSFIEFEGYIFRESGFCEDNLRAWERSTSNDRQAVEAVINHVHLLDLHSYGTPATEPQLRYLGRVLRDILDTKLKRDFPDRSFQVTFNDEPDLDLIDYEVTFWQID
jgi:hypothetical protein